MSQDFRIAIFASGSGTNAEAIIRHFKNHPTIKVAMVLSNNPKAFVLERAKKFDIPTKVFNRDEFDQMVPYLLDHRITHVVLAGFLWLIPESFIKSFPARIINIHPALLPKFGGKGMFGMKIHELVCSSKETETGITIHLIDEKYDEGRILFQGKCGVSSTDSPQEIADKVHRLEYAHYPEVIEKWISGALG